MNNLSEAASLSGSDNAWNLPRREARRADNKSPRLQDTRNDSDWACGQPPMRTDHPDEHVNHGPGSFLLCRVLTRDYGAGQWRSSPGTLNSNVWNHGLEKWCDRVSSPILDDTSRTVCSVIPSAPISQ